MAYIESKQFFSLTVTLGVKFGVRFREVVAILLKLLPWCHSLYDKTNFLKFQIVTSLESLYILAFLAMNQDLVNKIFSNVYCYIWQR